MPILAIYLISQYDTAQYIDILEKWRYKKVIKVIPGIRT